ncbi:uncharacterized protein LACBIDRAFT_333646 [Laccaria bicolor S238N-H82]|uniref:Predicted protein n=1 Tax=Laccaria bicolor (strain S238N-H82 / ATCC MYA-4686) TaxID=486041 RepID=B0DWR9_LACBS|nr:uncharacterized protein LACBIDRAFT_333646 [Laccaria bicolor S238N-H82]EDR00976.1 predicted protein [Laccaria bicolor S238N-H82]|eukprot:XP_001888371.1 predicted protein [Laccaria bicolor S238N-H82]
MALRLWSSFSWALVVVRHLFVSRSCYVADCNMARLARGGVRGSQAVACAGRHFSWALGVVRLNDGRRNVVARRLVAMLLLATWQLALLLENEKGGDVCALTKKMTWQPQRGAHRQLFRGHWSSIPLIGLLLPGGRGCWVIVCQFVVFLACGSLGGCCRFWAAMVVCEGGGYATLGSRFKLTQYRCSWKFKDLRIFVGPYGSMKFKVSVAPLSVRSRIAGHEKSEVDNWRGLRMICAGDQDANTTAIACMVNARPHMINILIEGQFVPAVRRFPDPLFQDQNQTKMGTNCVSRARTINNQGSRKSTNGAHHSHKATNNPRGKPRHNYATQTDDDDHVVVVSSYWFRLGTVMDTPRY